MRWWVKVAAARLLSALPGGAHLHYALQRFVTRTLPPSDASIAARLASARGHLEVLRRVAGWGPEGRTFFEFGAGWDLAIPLLYRAAGVPRQILVDLHPLARPWLVAHAVEAVRRLGSAAPGPQVLDFTLLPSIDPRTPSLVADLRSAGIDYRAPADARATGLDDASVDCVTSTATLEHVPADVIPAIMREMFRILKPGGVFSSDIDLSDHFAHGDRRITDWNFLRYDRRQWARINNALLFQNRLRASQYVAMARQAGFTVVEARRRYPPGADIDAMPWPPVHPSLGLGADRADVLATGLVLVGVR